MANQTPEAIAKWAEKKAQANTPKRGGDHNKGKPHLTGLEVADILRWHSQGLSQQEIATRLGRPNSQGQISQALAKYSPDRTAEAKQMIRAIAPNLVRSIAGSNDQKSKAVLLKGVNVLEEERQQGIVVHVGRGGMVNLGTVVSPPRIESAGESQ